MTRREFVLRKEGVEVARYPTRQAAWRDAEERDLLRNGGYGGFTSNSFRRGVTITEEPAKEQGGRDGLR